MPDDDHATVIVFDVADMRSATGIGMVPVPHHPRRRGKEKTTHTTLGGKERDLSKSSMLNCYRLHTIPYQGCFHVRCCRKTALAIMVSIVGGGKPTTP